MNAREYWNGKGRGIGDGGTNGNVAADPATTAIVPAGPAVPAAPAAPGAPAAPKAGKPILWLAGAAAAGALVTWLMLRNKRGDD